MHPFHHAKATPDKPAIVMVRPGGAAGETVTYAQLEARSNQGAQLFRSLGLKRGDAIAFMLENSARYLEICFAAQRSGILFTAMSTRLSAAEAEYILADCGAKVFLVSAGLEPMAAALAMRTPNLLKRYSVGGLLPGHESWENAAEAMPVARIADETAGKTMLYSSGTTGRPKGVKTELIGDGAIDETNPLLGLVQKLYGFSGDTRYLSPAPLYHAAPLHYNMSVLRLGGTVYVMSHFDAEESLGHIERHKISHSQWVPTMFVRMLKLPEAARARYDLSSMTTAIHAAAPCPVQVKEAMIAWWGPVINEYYGATEGNGFCACNSAEWLTHKGTVGRALIGELRIVSEDGVLQAASKAGAEPNVGTIYFANGPQFEYHNDAEKTASSRSKEGWTTLGDVGYVDDEGYLYLTDRKAYMIISGGVNIYPQEIENLLVTHPKVFDVAVIGVPNEDFGEEVKAVVQPARWEDAGPALEAELIAYCRANLSHVKAPRSVDFDRELPRHPTGKLYKRLVRDRYWQGRKGRLV
jgi:long-chain acyl-CoA synthetase